MPDDARPPYVTFETRAIEDRNATLDQGHYVSRDVVFALITPSGSRDRVEKEATTWLKDLEDAVQQERFPVGWLNAYKEALRYWTEAREIPETGFSVINWPMVSPAQVKNLLDINLRTVEDVAEATEEAISRMGMGGRALKEKAKAWLDSSATTGKVSGELEALRAENIRLKSRDIEREAKLKKLEVQVEAFQKVS